MTNPLMNPMMEALELEGQKLTERALEMGIGLTLDALAGLKKEEVQALLSYYNPTHNAKMALRDIIANGRPGNVLTACKSALQGIAHQQELDMQHIQRETNGQVYLNARLNVLVNRIRAGVAYITISDPNGSKYDAELTYGTTADTKAMIWQTFQTQEFYGDDEGKQPASFAGMKLEMSRWQAIDLVRTGQLTGPESMLPMKPESE